MPSRLKYDSYGLVSGVSQREDEQVFTRLLITNIENFRYIKEDAITSIDSYSSLGLDRNPENHSNDYIQMLRYKNSILAMTYNEIFRLNNDRIDHTKGYTFDKIGDYLNADVFTYIIAQLSEDIFSPAILVRQNIIYIMYRTLQKVVFEKFNLETGSREFKSELQTTDYTDFTLSLSPNDTEENLEIYAYNSSEKVKATPLLNRSPTLSFGTPEVGDNVNVKFPLTPPVIAGKTFYHLRKWGEFTYDGRLFHVVWTENDAYFVLDDKGIQVAKIGVNNAPSFDEDYYLNKETIVIEGDNIYIPLLLSTRRFVVTPDTVLQTDQQNLQRRTFFPQGLHIIHFKIDKLLPRVNAFEYANGMILSGPIIQNYDGNRFGEFNFSQKIGDFDIAPQETGAVQDFEQEFTYVDQMEELYSSNSNITFESTKIVSGIKSGVSSNFNVTMRHEPNNSRRWYPTTNKDFIDGNPIVTEQISDDWRINESDLDASGDIEIVTEGGSAASPSDLGFAGSSGELRYSNSGAISDDFGDFYKYDKLMVLRTTGGDLLSIYRWDRIYVDEVNDSVPGLDDETEENNYDFKQLYDDQIDGYTLPVLNALPPNPCRLEIYNLSSAAIWKNEFDASDDGVDLDSFDEVFESSETKNSGYQTLSAEEGKYSVRVLEEGDFLDIEIRNNSPEDNLIHEPPEAGFFTRLTIKQGQNTFMVGILGVDGAVQSTEEHTRNIRVPKGNINIDATNSESQITLHHEIDAVWRKKDSTPFSYTPSEGEPFSISEIEITPDSFEVKLTLDRPASQLPNPLRFSLLGAINYIFTAQSNQGMVATFTRQGLPITELSGQTQEDQLLSLRFQQLDEDDFDYTFLEKQVYQYAGFYKWIDQFGKEHISALSDQRAITIFGEIGVTYAQGDLSEKIEQVLTFNSLNLTSKTDVVFTLLRAQIAGTGASDVYSIVKEIPVDTDAESITITDDVQDSDTYGAVDGLSYSRIIQPPGAKSVAIGKRNKIFLGNVIGFQNALFFSNSLSSDSVDIFSFSTDATQSGILLFDNPIIAMDNLDTNLAIFTTRGIFYLPVESLRPQFIQESESNFATHPESIVSWKKGITFLNQKGISYLTRGFTIEWVSQNLIDVLADEDFRISDVKISEKAHEIRFRLEDGRVIVYHTEYKKWSIEKDLYGVEQEIDGYRYKFDDNTLYRSDKIPQRGENYRRPHVLETGWLNYTAASKGTLLRSIDLIGEFGDYSDFRVDLLYNYDDLNYEQKDITTTEKGAKVKRLSPKVQKIHALKIRIYINSDIVKLSSIGFQVRKQIGGANLGTKDNF